ncbi:AI-2E family transporter [Candidatus Woesearchaeota archaeon]|nr:AI-2E family transporter [Candidatus Woesearchaeota archaeon]
MIPKKYSRASFFLFFAIFIVLSLYVLFPFLHAIILGVLVAYIFYPIYDFMFQRVGERANLAAFLTTVGVFLILLVPLSIFLGTISGDVTSFYKFSKENILSGSFAQLDCTDRFLCKASDVINNLIQDPEVKKYISAGLGKLVALVLELTSNMLKSLPGVALNFFIFVFVLFYSFRDGKDVLQQAMALLPLNDSFKQDLKVQAKEVIYATVYGNIMVAIIQGIVGAIGFVLFGVSSPVLWGVVMMVAALIPFIGSALVWFPAALIIVFQGFVIGDTSTIWKGVGLMLYGLLFISTIDNLVKPKIIGRKTSLHPLLIMLGLFGGLATMGFLGLILGPLVLAFLTSFVRVYAKDKDKIFDHS